MTDEQASDWEYKIICCLGISTSNSDINVVGLHKTVTELYEQGRADEREAQVCCGDYEKCIKACTPRGRWLAEKELAKPEQSKYSDIVSDGGLDPRNKFDAQPEPVQVRPHEFIAMASKQANMIGKPVVWAEYPTPHKIILDEGWEWGHEARAKEALAQPVYKVAEAMQKNMLVYVGIDECEVVGYYYCDERQAMVLELEIKESK